MPRPLDRYFLHHFIALKAVSSVRLNRLPHGWSLSVVYDKKDNFGGSFIVGSDLHTARGELRVFRTSDAALSLLEDLHYRGTVSFDFGASSPQTGD